MKKQLNTLLISSCIVICGQAQAGLVKDGVWQIEQGDSLKSILKTALPEEPLRQKRLQRLSPLLNRKSFDGKGQLIVGQNLRLPGVRMPVADSVEQSPDTDQIGKILITNGPTLAKAADGKQRVLNRGSAINKGDTIQTKGARAQLRFSDGSLVALRPNTEFKVEEYNFNGQQDGSEKGIYNLIKGGFRTISGAIGKLNKNNYQVKTAVATIGIRGTHYGVTLCADGSCADQGLADGLYGGVVDGSILTSNDGGKSIFNNDEYFLISDIGSLAKELLAPPGVIFDDPAAPRAAQGEASSNKKKTTKTQQMDDIAAASTEDTGPNFDGTEDTPSIIEIGKIKTALPALPGTRAPGAVASFSFAATSPITGTSDSVASSVKDSGATANVYTDVDDVLENGPYLSGLAFIGNADNNIQTTTSIIGDVSNLSDTGEDTDLGLIWGRWSNTPLVVSAAGVNAQATPSTGIMYAVADAGNAIKSVNQLEDFGTDNSLAGPTDLNPVGGTGAYDLNGNRAGLTGTAAGINFTTQKLFFDVSATFGNPTDGQDVYNLHTGIDDPTDPDSKYVLFTNFIAPGSSVTLSGTCDGGSTGPACGGLAPVILSGQANFVFTEGIDNSQGPIPALGAAVSYSGNGTNLSTGNDVGIAGVAIFSSGGFGSPGI